MKLSITLNVVTEITMTLGITVKTVKIESNV
jgi:hypothetical protein